MRIHLVTGAVEYDPRFAATACKQYVRQKVRNGRKTHVQHDGVWCDRCQRRGLEWLCQYTSERGLPMFRREPMTEPVSILEFVKQEDL